MLGVKLPNSCRGATTGQLVHRRVALAQSDDMIPVAQSRKDFAKTPHAACVQWVIRRAPLTPEFFQSCGIEAGRAHSSARLPARINHLQQVAALRATNIG